MKFRRGEADGSAAPKRVPTATKRSAWFPRQTRSWRGDADGPTTPKRSPWLLMNLSGEHVVRGGKYDCCVTEAECARARILDGPLPWLCGGPAYKLAG